MDYTIIDIKKPDLKCVKDGISGQELIVVFKYNEKKFRITYIQEHYFYRGMPGTWGEHCRVQRIDYGEVVSTMVCDGEFRIPHPTHDEKGRPYVIKGYSGLGEADYCGDDPLYLEAKEETVRKYLIEPFIERYC